MRDGRLRRRTVRDQPYTYTYTDTYTNSGAIGVGNLSVREVAGFVYTI